MIKGFIFDLDGTLLNTLQSLASSFNRALTELGFPTHAVQEYRYFIGDGQRKCVERILPHEACTEANIVRMMQVQEADYSLSWREDAAPYDGILPLLEELHGAGTQLAVLSNKNHPFTVRCVEHFFGDIQFDRVLGFSAAVPHKPDPTGALTIAEELGLAPAEIAFVGDTRTDMATAVASGMTGVGVLWCFREQRELNDAGARHIIGHPSELIAVTQA